MLVRFIKDELGVFHQSDLIEWFNIEKALIKYMEENNIKKITKEQILELNIKKYKKNS